MKYKVYTLTIKIIFIILLITFLLLKPLNLYKIFTLLIGLIVIFTILMKNRPLMLFYIVSTLLMIRLYPYFDGLPLGVDPIRDVIFSRAIAETGTIPMDFPRQVIYYKYFPSIHLLSIFTSFSTNLEIVTTHYIINALAIALIATVLVFIVKQCTKKYSYIPIILYAYIPTIATWGYWIIPMIMAVTYMIISIYYISKIEKMVSKELLLGIIFTALTIMTHPLVGLILIIYLPFTILSSLIIDRKRIKPLVILFILSTIYALIYWQQVGFLTQLYQYYTNVILKRIFPRPPQPTIEKPYTTTIIVPEKPEAISYTGALYQLISTKPFIAEYFYVIPRWMWSSLLLILPALTLVIYRKRLGVIGLSNNLYGILLLLSAIFSLFFQIVWKADRYLASPATIFIIIAISTAITLRSRVRKILYLFIIILVVSSLLDPRISFYVNPFEGDRVTFNSKEKNILQYVIYRYNNSAIITDYNLMTSLSWFYSDKYDVNLRIMFSPLSNMVANFLKKTNVILIIRRYSVVSQFIYNRNYGNLKAVDKFVYVSNLVYSNNETFALYK